MFSGEYPCRLLLIRCLQKIADLFFHIGCDPDTSDSDVGTGSSFLLCQSADQLDLFFITGDFELIEVFQFFQDFGCLSGDVIV